MVIHHVTEIERGVRLPNDRTHIIVRDKITEFGSDIRRHVRERSIAASFDCLFFPEINDNGIMDARQLSRAIRRVRKYAWHLHERRRFIYCIFHQKQKRVAHILLEHRTHRFRRE